MGCLTGVWRCRHWGGWIRLVVGTTSEGSSLLPEDENTHTHTHTHTLRNTHKSALPRSRQLPQVLLLRVEVLWLSRQGLDKWSRLAILFAVFLLDHPSCMILVAAIEVNSLTPKSVPAGTKLVLFGKYVHNIYVGIVQYFLRTTKLSAPKSTYRHNAQIGE
jgi:hypothetical protein